MNPATAKEPSRWGLIAFVLGIFAWILLGVLANYMQQHNQSYNPEHPISKEEIAGQKVLVFTCMALSGIAALSGFSLAVADLFRSNRTRGWTYTALFICGLPTLGCLGAILLSAVS